MIITSHNFIMVKNSNDNNPRKTAPKNFRSFIENICTHIHTRNFQKSEQELLAYITNAFHLKTTGESALEETKEVLHILYERFNRYYIEWLEEHGHTVRDEVLALDSQEHPNFLLAHCTDPSGMDDMLWELRTYLDTLPNAQNREEMEYQLTCYGNA